MRKVDQSLIDAITDEVMKVVHSPIEPSAVPSKPSADAPSSVRPASFAAPPTIFECARCHDRTGEKSERAVITSTGTNKPGIAAELSSAIARLGGDIQDISQTIVGGFFTMIFVVDIKPVLAAGNSFQKFKDTIVEAAHRVGVEAFVMHEDILKAMHRV